MTATTVGIDWGLAALGIHETPREAREIVVRAGSLATRYGEHAAISRICVDRQSDVAGLLEPMSSDTSAAAVALVRCWPELLAATDLLPLPSDDVGRSEIIHSVHGVTPSGNWFLLADVGASEPSGHQLSQACDRPGDDVNDSWLVVVGRHNRDMISAEALDPTPAHAR